jgi:tetratricopeptide (TPR) repeat protein
LALGEVALLCSLAERNTAINQQASATDEAFHRSLQWNRIAERCYHGLPMPAAVREQRAWLGRKIGQLELGQELQNREVAPVGSIDLFMQSLIEYAEMKYPEAIATLEKLTEQEPSHAAAQYILGVQYQHFGRFADASERFQLAKVLMPKDPRPCLSRGLLLNLQNRPYDALTEYQQALKRDPAVLDAQYYRGKILTRLKKYDEALEAIQLAEKDPQLTYRALLYQAQILDKCHQTIRAQEVRKRAEKIEPQDEVDYVARGCDKLARKDYTGAYEDFVIATKLNKAYLHAWQNQANVLSEKLDQPEKALDALEQVTRITPNFAPAIIGEAVILARLGKRDQAHKLTTRALTITEDPLVSYQAACVYALTAGKSHSEDLLVAMSHFRQALRKGFHDFQLIADDHDVDSLRDRKDFQQALCSAQELNKK